MGCEILGGRHDVVGCPFTIELAIPLRPGVAMALLFGLAPAHDRLGCSYSTHLPLALGVLADSLGSAGQFGLLRLL